MTATVERLDYTSAGAARILPDLQQELAQLRAENAALKAAKAGGKYKVSDKGALSVYGLGQFPVTLYRSQWEALLAQKDDILGFIEANADKLSVKAKK